MSYQRNREETIYTLAREGWNLDAIRTLFRLAQAAQNHAINLCNRVVSEKEEKAQERRWERIEELVKQFGCTVDDHGDPRGFVVKIKLKSGISNHWGGQSWGIPTR